jgi:prepilin-type N-terminal cleavage/methylation domain-containing protein
MQTWKDRRGFTIIELAVALVVLSIVLLTAGILLINFMDTYVKITASGDTTTEARHCLEVISYDMRETIGDPDIADVTTPVDPLQPVTDDAMLLTSARQSRIQPRVGEFSLTADGFPLTESIILYYLSVTAEGETQLMKLPLYYDEDFTALGLAEPFDFILADPAYSGDNINIIEQLTGTSVSINRQTGLITNVGTGTAKNPAVQQPTVLMNRTESFDIVNDGVNPIQIRISCQTVDRFNRAITTRLTTEIEPRNEG